MLATVKLPLSGEEKQKAQDTSQQRRPYFEKRRNTI